MKSTGLDILFKELGPKIRDDSFTLYCYRSDIGGTIIGKPTAIAYPENRDDVSTILRTANEYNIPITIRGGGTTIGGETVAKESIVIDTKKLCRMINIDINKKNVCIESGMTWIELYDKLDKYNLTFNVAPASATCTIGGTISVGGFDNHSYIYGSSADQVEEIEVILPDGDIKVCSSEKNNLIFNNILYGNGLIGIITKIKMKITDKHNKSYESWFTYPDRKSALQDYFDACENETNDGIMYMEVSDQPIVCIENHEEPINCNRKNGKHLRIISENYINLAKNIYVQRIRMHSLGHLFGHSPMVPNFIDIVYPDKNSIYEMFDYADKMWKNIEKNGIRTIPAQKICLASRVKEDSKTRPFSPFPSNINKGDLVFGSYFGTDIYLKDYLKYHQLFNCKMIEKAIKMRCMLYKYCGNIRKFAKNTFLEERWNYLSRIKKKYDPNNILNRGVLFE